MVACAICGELLNSKIKITRHFEKKIIDMDLNHSGVDPRTLLWGFPPLFGKRFIRIKKEKFLMSRAKIHEVALFNDKFTLKS